jgi:indole-3-glycerol phosphate synthase
MYSAPTYLDDIIAYHRARASRDTRVYQDRIEGMFYEGPSFFDALNNAANPNVKLIAEIKRRSPSKGWLNEHLDPVALSRIYQRADAAAISVLTDEPYFSGSLEDLVDIHNNVTLPLLRKDFTISPNDVLDAVEVGASAVLLIVAALSDVELALLYTVAHECSLDCLVEVHDAHEMARARHLGANIIGINQRNLHTFDVDPGLAASLAASLPPGVLAVAESGMGAKSDVVAAARAGFDAVLVGEALVKSVDPLPLVLEFASVPRLGR